MAKCFKCGGEIYDRGSYSYCRSCNAYMPTNCRCPYCGSAVAYGITFCSGCGKKVDKCKGCGQVIALQVQHCPFCGFAHIPKKLKGTRNAPPTARTGKPIPASGKRYYIKFEEKYYTKKGKWSPNQFDGQYFSNATQAENVIQAIQLHGAYVSTK